MQTIRKISNFQLTRLMAGCEEGLFRLRFSGVSSVWCWVIGLVLGELVPAAGGALWSLWSLWGWGCGDLGGIWGRAPAAPLLLEAPLRELRGGESDLLRSRLALPMESPDLRLGLACLRLGPPLTPDTDPAGPGDALCLSRSAWWLVRLMGELWLELELLVLVCRWGILEAGSLVASVVEG